jgi:hypothetical protein
MRAEVRMIVKALKIQMLMYISKKLVQIVNNKLVEGRIRAVLKVKKH